jgi:DNA-binding Lrp family transcriptional regulator
MEVIVAVEITQMTQATVTAFETAVIQFDEVIEARRMFGSPDYLLTVTVADHRAYEAFVTTKLSTLPALARVNSHQTMKNLRRTTTAPTEAP